MFNADAIKRQLIAGRKGDNNIALPVNARQGHQITSIIDAKTGKRQIVFAKGKIGNGCLTKTSLQNECIATFTTGCFILSLARNQDIIASTTDQSVVASIANQDIVKRRANNVLNIGEDLCRRRLGAGPTRRRRIRIDRRGIVFRAIIQDLFDIGIGQTGAIVLIGGRGQGIAPYLGLIFKSIASLKGT